MANTIINGGASPYPKHVGPAPICSFSDGAQDAPLKSLKFYISPKQDLHGYSYPWPGGGGKNKLPITVANLKANNTAGTWSGNAYTHNGVTYTIATDNGGNVTSINTSGTASGRSQLFLWTSAYSYFADLGLTGSYILNGCPSGGNGNTYAVVAQAEGSGNIIDVGSGVTVNAASLTSQRYRFCIDIKSGVSAASLSFKPMLRLSTDTDATYAPYSNISPISGWSQVDGVAAGGNLLKMSDCIDGYYIVVNSTYPNGRIASISGASVFYASVPKNTTLTYSADAGDRCVIVGYKERPSTLSGAVADSVFINMGEQYLTATFNTGENTFVALYLNRYESTKPTKVMLETGSVATPYAAPTITPITISLGQTVYGGYEDALAGRLVIDRVGVAITNANEIGANHYAPIWRINYNAAASTAKAPASTSVTNIMCNAFKAVGEVNRGQPGTCFISGSSKWIQFDFSDTGIADANAAKTYFLSLNPFIVYELATPIEVDLTPVSVNSLLGQNNVWANTGDTELDYYPAAASVVAVLNRSSKVYTSIPLGKIRYDTYQTTPNQALDLDSYRAETGVLIRNVLSHTATKIEFNTPSMTNLQWEEVWNIIKAGFNNSTERKLKLKYYDQMSATYKTGWFYVPDVNFTIRNIDEANGIINYDEVRVAFIEY